MYGLIKSDGDTPMSTVFVILETTTNTFIDRDKVAVWNRGSLQDAHTWSDHKKAKIQAYRLNKEAVIYDSSFKSKDFKFVVKEAKIELI